MGLKIKFQGDVREAFFDALEQCSVERYTLWGVLSFIKLEENVVLVEDVHNDKAKNNWMIHVYQNNGNIPTGRISIEENQTIEIINGTIQIETRGTMVEVMFNEHFENIFLDCLAEYNYNAPLDRW